MYCVQFKKLKSILEITFSVNKSQNLLNIKSCNCEKLLHFNQTFKKLKTFKLNIFGEMGKNLKMLLLSIFGVMKKTPYLEGVIFCT